MRWIFGHRPPKNPRGWIVRDGDNELGIVDLGSDASLEVRHLIDRNLHNHGKPFETGGALSASCLPLLGAGSVAASSLAAGNVFLATANPATLMSIGSGVGSAVMGTGGIVAQAPFIAAGAAILPVVAPLAILMTVSSTMLSAKFDRLQTSLDSLTEAIHYLMKRDVNDDCARALSALARLQDIAGEWELSHRFTDDMKVRLALVERDLSVARFRHGLAINEPAPGKDMGTAVASLELKMRTMPVEQHLYALSSVAGIHAEGLRLRLAVQENSADLAEGSMRSMRASRRFVAAPANSLRATGLRGTWRRLKIRSRKRAGGNARSFSGGAAGRWKTPPNGRRRFATTNWPRFKTPSGPGCRPWRSGTTQPADNRSSTTETITGTANPGRTTLPTCVWSRRTMGPETRLPDQGDRLQQTMRKEPDIGWLAQFARGGASGRASSIRLENAQVHDDGMGAPLRSMEQPEIPLASTPGEFIESWRAWELKERAAAQEYFIDLCRLLGEPTPAETGFTEKSKYLDGRS